MTRIMIPLLLFFLVGGFTALILYGARDKYSKVGNGQFDERQLIAQGKGYKLGFFVMLTVAFVVYITEVFLQRALMGAGNALVIAVCLGEAASSVYCISKDAYISMKAPKGSGVVNLAFMGFLAAVSVMEGVWKIEEDGLFTDGRLGQCWTYFAITFLTAAVFVSLLVKMLLARRNRE